MNSFMYKIESWWEVAVQHREFNSVLCDDLEGWDGRAGGRLKREGIYVYVQLIHDVVRRN